MNNSLEDVFQQALEHRTTAVSKGEREHFGLWYGVKISKDLLTQQIVIYNTTIGGDYYKEISNSDYERFLINGWELGVSYIRLNNYLRKISNINNLIQTLMNKKKFSNKRYHDYKKARDKYMGNYADTIKLINKSIKKQKNGNNKNNEIKI